jgi:hypothetical protein
MLTLVALYERLEEAGRYLGSPNCFLVVVDCPASTSDTRCDTYRPL